MYPLDSDLHLVALSPRLQHQQSSTTVTLNIQHHLQQAAKYLPVVTTQRSSNPPAIRGDDYTSPIPSRHSGGGIMRHSEPTTTVTSSQGKRGPTGFPQPPLPSVCGHGIQICVETSILYGVLNMKKETRRPFLGNPCSRDLCCHPWQPSNNHEALIPSPPPLYGHPYKHEP